MERTGWRRLVLERAWAHTDLEVRLSMQTLEEEDQLVAATSGRKIDCLEPERIYLAVGHAKEVRCMVKGPGELGAA